MFCMSCGKPLTEGAMFCRYCGTRISNNLPPQANNPNVININQGTRFVPGNCTNCGAALQVDPSLQAAICPACGTPYIVQQAINNFNFHSTGNISIQNAVISVPGANAENYVKRAIGLEQQYDLIKALEFYNKALDADAGNQAALVSVARINRLLDDYGFRVGRANMVFSSGKLLLKKDKLEYTTNKGKVTTYDLSLITDVRTSIGCLEFVYNGNKDRPVSFGCDKASDWVAAIVKAKNGDYPKISMENLIKQSNYQTYFNDFKSFLSKNGIKSNGENENRHYSVILLKEGSDSSNVSNLIKEYKKCGWYQAATILQNLPEIIYTTTNKSEAENIAARFKSIGATIEIR